MKALALCLICLPLYSLHITSPFGQRKHLLTGLYSFHNGIDLRARSDTVYAVADGRLSIVAYDRALGIHVVIRHQGFSTVYGHLSRVLAFPGADLSAGEAIGITGKTGRVTAEHLHFSIRSGNRWVEPLAFIFKLINNKYHE
ncbi:M23 family metallopeptidase [Mucilaginibacter conchicola]|uniref:M23 family metallopeptidase n=1 Tax=Mucilaginibacter conchicola TaxID=2303333 RepID=UPI0013145065|nr:M23 family metallopeptidase [Mucilaginibacter conchicola]